MQSTEIKDAIKEKLGFEEEIEEIVVDDQKDLIREAVVNGHKSFISGVDIEDNPFSTEDEIYLHEAWSDGWTGAFDSMVLSSVVVVSKNLVEAESAEEVSFYFDELKEACRAINPHVFEEFQTFLVECTKESSEEEDLVGEE